MRHVDWLKSKFIGTHLLRLCCHGIGSSASCTNECFCYAFVPMLWAAQLLVDGACRIAVIISPLQLCYLHVANHAFGVIFNAFPAWATRISWLIHLTQQFPLKVLLLHQHKRCTRNAILLLCPSNKFRCIWRACTALLLRAV